jgi:hypothetical protein
VIRVVLPQHLRTMAGTGKEVTLEVEGTPTVNAAIDALETRHPMLRGTLRDPVSRKRRSLIRYYALRRDLSHDPPDAPLPDAVARGEEPLIMVGAIAGG